MLATQKQNFQINLLVQTGYRVTGLSFCDIILGTVLSELSKAHEVGQRRKELTRREL
jgi:hypothetical protein